MKKTIYFLYAGTFLYSSICAQNAPTARQDTAKILADSIKTVTITATRTEKDVMDVGRSVTVISGSQLNVPGCNTVAEILSQQEGIYITGARQNPGAIQSLFLRGADNNHTEIMIDGVPLSDPSTDHGEIDLSELSLGDVDRIEIVRGSHSTLYGSSAIGGVINIITKKNYTPGVHVTASVTGGEFGSKTSTFEENVILNYTFHDGMYVTGGYHRIDDKGLNSTVDTLTHPQSFQMSPDRDNYNKVDPFAKIGFYNKQWDVYAEYRNTIQNSDADAAAFEDLKNATDHFVRDFYTGGITYKPTDNLHIQYTGSYSHDNRTYNQGSDTIAPGEATTENDFFKGTSMFQDFKADYNWQASHFIIGGGYTKESMGINTYSYNSLYGSYDDTPDSVKFQQSTTNLYAQADINGETFNSALSPYNLLLGIRYSNNSVFGNNVTYDINPSVKFGANSLLFLSYSTGFSDPSLYELYAPNKYGDNPATSYTLGNSSLKAEKSSSFEIGVKHAVSKNLFFTLSWFQTTVDNHIDYVALWNPNKPIDSLGYGDNLGDRYINLGQETTQGFELSVFLKLSPTVNVSGNVSLLSSILKYNTSAIDTSQTHNARVQIYDGGGFLGQANQNTGLLRRPGSLANFSITWRPLQKLAITLKTRYVGTSYDAVYNSSLGVNYYGAIAFTNVADYTLVDASASYDITKQFSVMVRGENLFNTTYYEILGYTTRGRSFYLNLRFAF